MFELSLSLAPIFLLIALGWTFRRSGFPQEEFWLAAQRLVHFLLFPALLLSWLATADLTDVKVTPLIAAVAASVMVMALAVMMIGWKLISGGPVFASVFQGSIRFNAYLGAAAAAVLFGRDGEMLAAIVIAVMVPLGEALSIVALGRQAGRNTPSFGILSTSLIRNPLILAILAGIFLNTTGIGLPSISETFVDFLGRAALPIGLLCVGASFDLSGLGKSLKPILATTTLKLLVMPVFMLVACSTFGISGLAAKVALLFAALPPSLPSYNVARQLGDDAKLISNLMTIATLVGLVTLPAIMFIYD
tara:strand:- start:573 stop:1487 length:915 start_codon:yes stop_codon:yes gene_type:complete